MGRKVSNLYGTLPNKELMTLQIDSPGIYSLEITFKTDDYNQLKKYNWCYDTGKGLVYMSDLTMELPKQMGYVTPRVYLRDLLVFNTGHWKDGKPTVIWNRRSIDDYDFDIRRCRQLKHFVEPSQNKT